MSSQRLFRQFAKRALVEALVLSRRLPGRASWAAPLRHRLNVATVGSHEMFLDATDSLGLRGAPYEPFESEVFRRLVRPGNVAIDIGANIGYYTLLLAAAVGRRGRVLAFEPDPTNFLLLSRNLRLNGYRNASVFEAAISDRDETARLYLAAGHAGDHRLHDFWKDRTGIAVRTHRLDSFLSSTSLAVDCIKMDIQGAEARALRGMERTLQVNPGVVLLTEFSPRLLAEVGDSGSAFSRRLEELGFILHEIAEKARKLVKVSSTDLDRAFERESRLEGEGYTNLLCVRGALPAGLETLVK